MKNKIKFIIPILTSLIIVSYATNGDNVFNKKSDSTIENNDSLTRQNKKYIKGCYAAWKHNEFPIDSVKFNELTHLTLCFAYPNDDGTLNTSQINDIDDIVSKCHQNDVKIVLCIGGAADSESFPIVSKDSVLRQKFVTNLSNYVNNHKIDGVEIDWEYWPTPEKVDTIVSDAIVSLFRDLRSSLPDKVALSYDVYSGNWYGKHYPSELINFVDEIVIMAFAATGPWSEIGHHSPHSLVEESYNYWIGRIGKQNYGKVVISTPFYGFNFRNDHKKGNNSTAPNIGYSDILSEHPEAYLQDTVVTDSSIIFHNSITTFKQKTDFIKAYDLKGISIWELSFDMNTKDKSLLKYVSDELKE